MGFGDWVCVRPAPGAGAGRAPAIESARSNSRRVVNECITVGVCVTINSYYRRSQGDGGAIRARAASPCVSRRLSYLVLSFKNAIKLARSSGFLRPAKTIFVPGMYFFGFNR